MVAIKKYIFISLIIIVCTFLLITEDLLPSRIEIAEMEIIEIMGLDYIDDKPSITIIRNSLTKGSDSKEETDKVQEQNVVTVSADTFEEALDLVQLSSDKYVSLSHVEYILIGEAAFKQGVDEIVNFLGHSTKIGVNAYIYEIKSMSSFNFIEEVQSTDYTIKDKLDNMMSDDLNKSITKDKDIGDLLEISLREDQEGVIPVLTLTTENEDINIYDKKDTDYFIYSGLAVIKDMKSVDYVGIEDTFGFNIITEKVNNYTMKVDVEEGYIVVGLNNIITKAKYSFENNILKKITYNISLVAKIEEFSLEGDLTSYSMISEYEDYINSKVKDIVMSSIEKCFETDVDYFYFEDMINRSNPYKYRKMKNNCDDDCFSIIKDAEVVINIDSKIETSYDMINTNSNQKGI